MRKTALIYGYKGQDGIYLSDLFKKHDYEVIGLDRINSNDQNFKLTVFDEVSLAVKRFKPTVICHLAANSTTAIEALFENHETICTGALNILEAVRRYSPDTKIFLTGSGLQFENSGKPIHETDRFDARNAYAVCRIHSAYAARFYRSLGIRVYIGYLFNHDSPFRTERHINKKIAAAAKRISLGSSEKLFIGDLSVIKEFGFAGDIVEGIFKLIEQENIFEAVIGTGIGYNIEEWVNICFSYFNLDWQRYVELIPGFFPENKILISNPNSIFSLGWKPNTTIQTLAQMMVNV